MALDEKRRQKKLAKKAAERKAKQAERRSLTTGGSSALAARFPVSHCLVPISLFSEGIGHLVLTRSLPGGQLALAGFLVDTYCLGVKNAMYRVVSPEEFEYYRQHIHERTPLESVHPSCLRKLVEEAVNYARDIGFSPHSDYAKAARLFGDIDASACPVRYTFGKNGRPCYINGPYENLQQQQKIIETLKRNLGPDGFEQVMIMGDPDDMEMDAELQSGGSLQLISYEITDEPLPDPVFERMPQPDKDQLQKAHGALLKKPGEALPVLLSLVERYPDLPMIYNYLHIAYRLLNDRANAERILQETLKRFPDYLFGRIDYANDCLDKGDIDKVEEILEGKYDLKLLYPDRQRFHFSEVLSFGAVMARYFHAKGDKERAEMYFKALQKIDPTHQTTRAIDQLLHRRSIGEWLRNLLPGR